jgi:hypothetical protein
VQVYQKEISAFRATKEPVFFFFLLWRLVLVFIADKVDTGRRPFYGTTPVLDSMNTFWSSLGTLDSLMMGASRLTDATKEYAP